MAKSIFRVTSQFDHDLRLREEKRANEQKEATKKKRPRKVDFYEFRRAQDILDGIKWAEDYESRKARRLKARQCDWDDRREVYLYKHDKRKKKKEYFLNRIVPERVCPICNNKILLINSWTIKRGEAKCKSCSASKTRVLSGQTIPIDFVTGKEELISINPLALLRFRKGVWASSSIGSSLASFGSECGWSGVYQHQLEGGEFLTIKQDKYSIIERVLINKGYEPSYIRDKLIKSVEDRCVINGWRLGVIRDATGIGIKAFSMKMGWSVTRQDGIERNRARTLSAKATIKILDYFRELAIKNPLIIVYDEHTINY